MTAGRGYHGARRINARARNKIRVDRLLQRKGRAAQVTNRRKAAHQRALRLGARGEIDVADIGGHECRERKRRKDRMPMRVD